MENPAKRPGPEGVEVRPRWTWDPDERKQLREELEDRGDPIADWLEAKGVQTRRQGGTIVP